jgi:hypothetical protein
MYTESDELIAQSLDHAETAEDKALLLRIRSRNSEFPVFG